MNPLSKISNQELETRLKAFVSQERKLLHVILEHIKEVDTRKLYLERAYGSMYEYLTKELQYSGSAAMRRLEAARLLREIPDMKTKIQEGTLNLTQIGELSRAIKEKEKNTHERISASEKAELIEKISGKSTPETQKELALSLDLEIKQSNSQRVYQDGSVRLEFTVSQALYEKLKSTTAAVPQSVKPDIEDQDLKGNKTLTPKTKAFILSRDRQCQYRDPKTGKLCGSRYALQVDHRHSRWAGGTYGITNLQALCANHNSYKYQKESSIQRL